MQPINEPDDAITVDEVVDLDPQMLATIAMVDQAFLDDVLRKNAHEYLKDCFVDGTLPFKDEFLMDFNLRMDSQPKFIQADIELICQPEVGPSLFVLMPSRLNVSPRL